MSFLPPLSCVCLSLFLCLPASVCLSLCLSVSLWVFLSPAGLARVKTGPLVGRRLPILDTHFLSPSRELAQLTPSCPESRGAPEALACKAKSPFLELGLGMARPWKAGGPHQRARWVTPGTPPYPSPPATLASLLGAPGGLRGCWKAGSRVESLQPPPSGQ